MRCTAYCEWFSKGRLTGLLGGLYCSKDSFGQATIPSLRCKVSDCQARNETLVVRAQTTLLLVPFQPTLGWRIILWSAEGWFDSPFKNLSSEQEQEFEQSCVRKPSGARTWLGLVRPRHRATLSTFSTTQDLWSPLSQRTWWRERQRMWKWSDSRSGIRSGSSSISPSSWDLHLLGWL